eukprot:1252078-Prorocentrum_lima.AAC.1
MVPPPRCQQQVWTSSDPAEKQKRKKLPSQRECGLMVLVPSPRCQQPVFESSDPAARNKLSAGL